MRSFWKMALLALPAACATVKVSTNEEPGAASIAARYKTFAWLPTPQRDESHNNPSVEAELKRDVDRDLAAKHYSRVECSDHPDFLIGWHVTTMEKTQVEAINPYWGYRWNPVFGPPVVYGGAFGPGASYPKEYEQGTVILDIIDAHNNRLIWRGAATANLGANPTGENALKKVNQAADKILSQFPPKA